MTIVISGSVQTTDYNNFLREVLPYVPECPEPVALNAIRNASIEFCEKTLYWLHTHAPLNVLAGQSDYTLDLPAGSTTAVVLDAWCDELPLVPKGEDELRAVYPLNWPDMVGWPKYITQQTQNTVTLVPQPDIDVPQGLTLTVALKPTRDSTGVGANIYDNWAEGIGYGARARLHELPNQSYSDANMAMLCRSKFNNIMGKATIARNRGLTRATQHVRPRRFF